MSKVTVNEVRVSIDGDHFDAGHTQMFGEGHAETAEADNGDFQHAATCLWSRDGLCVSCMILIT